MRKFLVATFAAGITLLAANTTRACICPPYSPVKPTQEQVRAALAKDFDEAFAVFSGEVVESGWLKVKFKVDGVWKGEIGDEIEISTGVKDNGDGTFVTDSCDYRDFAKGEKYLVFTHGSSLKEMTARKCDGTKPLAFAEQDVKNLDGIRPHETRNPQPEARPEQQPPPVKIASRNKRT